MFPSTQAKDATTTSVNDTASLNGSIKTHIEQGQTFIPRVALTHKKFVEDVLRPELPQSLQSPVQISSQQSHTRLPQLNVRLQDNLIDSVQKEFNSTATSKPVEEVKAEILNGSLLKTDKVIMETLQGKRTFMYSQQTLNKQRLHNRVFVKENANVA